MDRSLRRLAEQDSKCNDLFLEAYNLSLGIAKNPMGRWSLVPYFTDHSPSHLDAVERILDRLIFGGESERAVFMPTPEEAMYLLSAVWLHDIGMYYGILPHEDPEVDDVNWDRVRDEHEQRSARYIQNEWKLNCTWSDEQKIYLSALCIYHRRKHDLRSFVPTIARESTDRPVRLRDLAALLRLADACHIDSSRSPPDLRALFTSVGMPEDSKTHWQLPMQVSGVDFDHSSHSIRPRFMLPNGRRSGTIEIDYSPVAETITAHLTEELASVSDCLGQYSNVGFRMVRPHKIQAGYIVEKDALLLSIWPLLLERVVSPSEAASLVAALVQTCVHKRQQLPRNQIEEIVNRAKRQQPYNVLLLRLARDVEKSMANSTNGMATSTVARCKELYLDQRIAACDVVAASAAPFIECAADLVISSYSHNVMTFIKRRQNPQGRVIVVRTDGTEPQSIAEAAYRRLVVELDQDRIPFMVVELASLPSVLRRSNPKPTNVWYLPGCYGVISGEQVLTPVGSEAIAVIVKSAGGRVAVLAEAEKISSGDELSELLSEAAWKSVAQLPIGDGAARFIKARANLDVLTKDMFDTILGPPETVIAPFALDS